jgi:hypothetical protein
MNPKKDSSTSSKPSPEKMLTCGTM